MSTLATPEPPSEAAAESVTVPRTLRPGSARLPVGAVVSRFHVHVAALPSVFPATSIARTANVCVPGATPENAFGDMQTVNARLYNPDVAVLPIGDHYTMGPDEAALAVELLGVRRVVPCHWGTFPALTGTPDALAEKVGGDVTVERLQPGDTVTI